MQYRDGLPACVMAASGQAGGQRKARGFEVRVVTMESCYCDRARS
jgi:hypothetical protein